MKTISVFYCLLCAAGIEGADIHVEGLAGGEVSFQCSHRLAWKNNKYICKDPCKDSDDTLVTVVSGGRVESGRITLVDSGDGAFTVTFSQLQLSDVGRYWCAVDRTGFDTFTAVQLNVKKAVANETTTVTPERSPTWTYQDISNSTQLTSGMDTNSTPANLSAASNSTTGGEQYISTGTVLYATVGAIAMLTILMLPVIIRKCRENAKPQPQVRCNSADLVSADEREADCECNEIGEEVQSIKKISERFSCTHHPKQDPPTAASTAAECSAPLPIYENICRSKGTAHSRYSAANVRDEHDNFRIYIKPLPRERTGDGRPRKHTNKHTLTTNATSKPTERPRSLWFGLDLSGTV